MATATAAAAAGALNPFVQLKGRRGGEWLCDHQQSIGQPMRLMTSTRPLSTSRQQKQCAAGAVASATSSRPSSIYQYPSSYSSSIDNRNQQSTPSCLKKMDDDENNNNNKLTPEKLDQWIRDSVGEIVSNIGDAPFLVHIFSNGPMLRLEKEEALPESWPSIKKRWDQGTCTPPDGVILVEELKDEDTAIRNGGMKGIDSVEEEANKTWGLVVQGKGMDCASCYILNTCRVRSTMGFCTHFCLLRAKCFGDPFKMQIRKAWLQCR